MFVHQALNYNDFRQKLAFCNWIRQQSHDFHLKILFSDECTFKSDGSVNTWNSRYWAQINPHWLREINHQTVRKSMFGVALLEVKSLVLFSLTKI